MPSFAIPKFTVLLEPLWVSAEFLLLSTGPLSYIIEMLFPIADGNHLSTTDFEVVDCVKHYIVPLSTLQPAWKTFPDICRFAPSALRASRIL